MGLAPGLGWLAFEVQMPDMSGNIETESGDNILTEDGGEILTEN